MPPFLALLLCTGFVLFLLLVEARASAREVSAALWIPTVWILITASRALSLWVGWSGTNDTGSLPDRVVLTALGIAGIVVLAHRRFNWFATLRAQRWLLVLLGYMFLSTFWSGITLIALKRWAREWVVIILALVIVSETNPCRALASLLRRTAYVLLPFSLMLIKYYPALGRRYGRWSGLTMWVGVTMQKNTLGRLCMISVFFLAWALYQRRRRRPNTRERYESWADVAVILLGLYLLIGAHSATSVATLLVGVAMYASLHWMRKIKLEVPVFGLLLLSTVLVVFGASAPFLGGSNVAIFSADLGRDKTLTGRTDVWADVLPAFRQQPLLGYGFGSFWTDAQREKYDIPNAHNGYLDILLDLGFLGLAFYIPWLLSCARQLHRALAQDYAWASFGICLLIMTLVYNTTESALNDLGDYMTVVVILSSFAIVAQFSRSVSRVPHRFPLDRPELHPAGKAAEFAASPLPTWDAQSGSQCKDLWPNLLSGW